MMPGVERHAPGPLRKAALRPRLNRSAVAAVLVSAGLGAALVVGFIEGEPASDPTPATTQALPVEPAHEASPREGGPGGGLPEEQSVAEKPPVAGPSSEEPGPILPKLDAAERAADLVEGERLLARGDLAAARLFFRRVAEAGDPRGAEGMARTYDPAALAALPLYGVAGDAAAAQRWREAARAAASRNSDPAP